jgi:hypothetical protein
LKIIHFSSPDEFRRWLDPLLISDSAKGKRLDALTGGPAKRPA